MLPRNIGCFTRDLILIPDQANIVRTGLYTEKLHFFACHVQFPANRIRREKVFFHEKIRVMLDQTHEILNIDQPAMRT